MIIKVNAIPLRIVEWSESSQILTVISDKYGRISGVAKGARRLKSPFDGPFDYLNLYQLVMVRRPGQRLGTWTESYLYDRRDVIRSNYAALNVALSCTERVRELTEDEEPSEVFNILNSALDDLQNLKTPLTVHNEFTVKLLKETGYEPVTEYCVSTGRKKTKIGPAFFSPYMGGILSPLSVHEDTNAVMISEEEMQFIRSVIRDSKVEDLPLKKARSLNQQLTLMTQHIIGKGLRMSRYLSKMISLLLITMLLSCSGRKVTDQTAEELYQIGYEELRQDRSTWESFVFFFFGTHFDDLNEYYPESKLIAESLYQTALKQKEDDDLNDMRRSLKSLLALYPTYEKYDEASNLLFQSMKTLFIDSKIEANGRVIYNVSTEDLKDMLSISALSPYSENADEALMMVADTYLGRHDFDEAELIYRDILGRLDKNSPYFVEAQYKLALSLWDRAVVRIRGFFSRYLRNPKESLSFKDRSIAVRYSDRYPTEAEIEFNELIKKYPNSPRVNDAQNILKEIEQLKSHKHFVLGDFYEFYGQKETAIYYFRKVDIDSEIYELAQKREVQLLEEE